MAHDISFKCIMINCMSVLERLFFFMTSHSLEKKQKTPMLDKSEIHRYFTAIFNLIK